MDKIKITLQNGNIIEVEKGIELYQIAKDNNIFNDNIIALAKFNGKIVELSYKPLESGRISYIGIGNSIGMKAYIRGLTFLLIKAVNDVLPNSKVTIEHSIGKGIFGEIHKNSKLKSQELKAIKKRMLELVKADIKFNRHAIDRDAAIEIFKAYDMDDKVKLLSHLEKETVTFYEMDGRYDYFFGDLVYSTGMLKTFDLMIYETGFILKLPNNENHREVAKFEEQKKLKKIFYEAEQWGNIMDIADVGSLNNKVVDGDIIDIIRVNEALHEKKIALIADKISDKKEAKVVLIAGPSSSGKTTFARRLGIQLRVNGYLPIPISLDDYFVERARTPIDENGEYDFESIYALDLELFNKNLMDLMEGKSTITPTFDFRTGNRIWDNNPKKIPENGILIVEGIHGLNEMLTSSIPKKNKFKVYISALTQLNMDNHNRISTTDVRMLRRIVRDSLSRGYGAKETIKMWPSIKRGEERNIFVFQEEADAMFNSTLIYELCVLKKYAISELKKITIEDDEFHEAERLVRFLDSFREVDIDKVPDTSIMREFVGGSFFYSY